MNPVVESIEKTMAVDPRSGLGESLIRNGLPLEIVTKEEAERLLGVTFDEPDSEG